MFGKIPPNRMLIYILIAGLIPVGFALMNFFNKWQQVKNLEYKIEHVTHLARQREKRQALNMAVRQNFADSDHFYIDKNLESLSFLEPETQNLQKIVSNKNFAGDEDIKKRLEFLTGAGNHLLFSEGNVQTYPYFKEMTDTLVHPVEVNLDDIKKVLARVEGIEIGPYESQPKRPQLIIIDFKLDKKRVMSKNEVYLLNMKLLKREFYE